MDLQTKIPIGKQSDNLIDYNSNILLLGSCFVENIGQKLDYFKFQNLQNPFGILFNPVVIERLVSNATNEKTYSEDDVFFQNERWHCFDAHSELSSFSKEELINNLNASIKVTNKQIRTSTHIIITLGTAWVYRNLQTDKIVANCHKMPQKEFKKELLSIDAIKESLETIVSNIVKVNPGVSIIFTVSPVRHLKDGFVENQQSKAHLISAIHQFLNASGSMSAVVGYFPSYEIMMDELRDYRFYAEDMIHPNQTAINYIWEKVKQKWISQDIYSTMNDVETVQKGLLHKPFNLNSQEYAMFTKTLRSQKEALTKKHPQIRF